MCTRGTVEGTILCIVAVAYKCLCLQDRPSSCSSLCKKFALPPITHDPSSRSDPSLITTEKLIEWLQSHEGLTVLVDPSEDKLIGPDGKDQGRVFMPEVGRFDARSLATQTDFIICLGGDGKSSAFARIGDAGFLRTSDSSHAPCFGLRHCVFLALVLEFLVCVFSLCTLQCV